jgi:hypothetical protein
VIPNGSTVNGITYASSQGSALVTDAFFVTTIPNGLGQSSDGFFEGFDTITFTFAGPAVAFGIDINTFATAPGAYTATTNTGEVGPSVFNPFPTTGQFIGFSTNVPFTSVTIASPADVSYTLDTLRLVRVTATVPEASPVLFGGLAAAVIGCGAWLRRRAPAG